MPIKTAKQIVSIFQEFSIPLILGVCTALYWANSNPISYQEMIHHIPIPALAKFDFHFWINDVFMTFFFGIAAVEICKSLLPGGDLYPLRKAILPIFATMGGVIGPILVFLLLCKINGREDFYSGWAIPTATDIALAWLVAKFIFGSRHPAISFLLLLAILDDAIGLGIIAIFYPDPSRPVQISYLLGLIIAMISAFALRKLSFYTMWLYLLGPGLLAWFSLFKAGIHPALSLAFIVPFFPSAKIGMRESDNCLQEFEDRFKTIVDIGLFGFGLVNAGVPLKEISSLSIFILAALFLGKTIGIFGFTYLGQKIFKISLAENLRRREIFIVGIIASIGLTVSLFIAGMAYVDMVNTNAAKMGALLSVFSGFIAYILARAIGIKRIS